MITDWQQDENKHPVGGKYILGEDGRPVFEPDVLTWARWFETADRSVAQSTVGPARVSTVFLGLDHRFHGAGDPVLFETMVFDAPDGEPRMRRYTCREEAMAGHLEVIAEVQQMLKELCP